MKLEKIRQEWFHSAGKSRLMRKVEKALAKRAARSFRRRANRVAAKEALAGSS